MFSALHFVCDEEGRGLRRRSRHSLSPGALFASCLPSLPAWYPFAVGSIMVVLDSSSSTISASSYWILYFMGVFCGTLIAAVAISVVAKTVRDSMRPTPTPPGMILQNGVMRPAPRAQLRLAPIFTVMVDPASSASSDDRDDDLGKAGAAVAAKPVEVDDFGDGQPGVALQEIAAERSSATSSSCTQRGCCGLLWVVVGCGGLLWVVIVMDCARCRCCCSRCF